MKKGFDSINKGNRRYHACCIRLPVIHSADVLLHSVHSVLHFLQLLYLPAELSYASVHPAAQVFLSASLNKTDNIYPKERIIQPLI